MVVWHEWLRQMSAKHLYGSSNLSATSNFSFKSNEIHIYIYFASFCKNANCKSARMFNGRCNDSY